jgi:hypothetical protein
MRSIRFQRLSISEAEDLIILLSLITEAQRIATPRLTSSRQVEGLEIVLTFESEAQRAAVELQMRGYSKENGSVRPMAVP